MTASQNARRTNFITKVTAPFVSRQRSTIEHEIRLDEPFRQYFPGDAVKGAVHLRAAKPVRATHLVVRLHGFVKVINHAKSPGEIIPYDENLLTSTKGRRGIEYFGNGFARLFEDETILCGDGRLLGQYIFRFELVLPVKNVPSSIDFEHGTISYLVTSTLTRPITISPISSVHHNIKVREAIDIARVKAPKASAVSLEVIGKKRPLSRTKKRPLAAYNEKGLDSGNFEGSGDAQQTTINVLSNDTSPQSPVPSEISTASVTSSTNSGNENANRPHIITQSSSSTEYSADPSVSHQTITAQIELLQGACVAGDILPVKVSIDHIKPIKSMQGLIVTLYRQGRIDTHPAIPLGPFGSGDDPVYEDYYPRSRTGLGGLSLTTAGSSRTFRQDLAQTITPLIINPQTMTVSIETSVQVPDHVFPTITCVPGSMVSFKYFVEVVIDLRGKLAGQDRFLPRLNMTHDPMSIGHGDPKLNKVDDIDGVSFSTTPGFNYLITDRIRRTKGVVFTATEVIIGTRDSRRVKRKRAEGGTGPNLHPASEEPNSQNGGQGEVTNAEQLKNIDSSHATTGNNLPYSFVLPPSGPMEELDEKAQLRQAEQRLLPSAPSEESPSSSALASAPPALNEEDFVHRYALQPSAPAYDHVHNSSPPPFSQSNLQTPRIADVAPTETSANVNDDKEDFEHRRLQALTSSPEGQGDDIATMPHLKPSAPIVDGDDWEKYRNHADTVTEGTLTVEPCSSAGVPSQLHTLLQSNEGSSGARLNGLDAG